MSFSFGTPTANPFSSLVLNSPAPGSSQNVNGYKFGDGASTPKSIFSHLASVTPDVTKPATKAEQGAKLLETLLDKFEEYFDTGMFSDFKIKVHGKEYNVHKSIIAPQSTRFNEMFNSESEEKEEVFNNVKNFKDETFAEFLRYFYTNKIKVDANTFDMFELASVFDVALLKARCEDDILSNLNETNLLEAYNIENPSEKLKRRVNIEIKKNFPEVSEEKMKDSKYINELITTKRHLDELLKKGKTA